MQRILVLNSKGGCGKTTIATNLASRYASEGQVTAIVDHDPQGSSMRWLSLRPKEKNEIFGVPAFSRRRSGVTMSWHRRVLPGSDKVIIDAPAGIMGQPLQELVRQVDIILVPVLPSPIDIHAATRFIEELLLVGKVRSFGVQVAVIANRAKKNTLVYQSLERFLIALKLPFVATLRDTQNYVRASARGIGIFEMWDQRVQQDKVQWDPIVEWIDSIAPRQKDIEAISSNI